MRGPGVRDVLLSALLGLAFLVIDDCYTRQLLRLFVLLGVFGRHLRQRRAEMRRVRHAQVDLAAIIVAGVWESKENMREYEESCQNNALWSFRLVASKKNTDTHEDVPDAGGHAQR